MSIYQNQGASCITCLWQEDSLKGNITAKYQCKKCRDKDSRPGWEPKPNVMVNYFNAENSNGKRIMVRKVIES
jgi:hypothetical protein